MAFLRDTIIFDERLIKPLETILKSTNDKIIDRHSIMCIIWMAAYVLGTIDKDNFLAIKKLVDIISNPQCISDYYVSARYLAKIDPNNKNFAQHIN